MLSLIPNVFGEDLFDRFMDFPMERDARRPMPKTDMRLMKTDIKETDEGYELLVDLPGYNKEDVSLKLENGYLTISAETKKEVNEGEQGDNYIRRERYYGSCSRSFYVGEALKTEDIKAKMENGILNVNFPKEQPQLAQSGTITIA